MAGTTHRRDRTDGLEIRRPNRSLEEVQSVLLLTSSLTDGGAHRYRDLQPITPAHEYNAVSLIFTASHLSRADWWTEITDHQPERTVVIDATPSPNSQAVTDEHESVIVRQIDSPGNLTRIGIEVSQLPERVDTAEPTIVSVRSVTTLLQYVETKPAYRFLNLVTDRITAMNGVGLFHLDPAAHSEQTVTTLVSLFDAVLEPNDKDDVTRHR